MYGHQGVGDQDAGKWVLECGLVSSMFTRVLGFVRELESGILDTGLCWSVGLELGIGIGLGSVERCIKVQIGLD